MWVQFVIFLLLELKIKILLMNTRENYYINNIKKNQLFL